MNGSSLAYFSLFVGIQVEWSDANRHTIIRPGWRQPSWRYHGGSVPKRRNLGLPGNNLTKWSVLHLNLRPPDHRTSASTTRQRRLLMRMCSSLWVCLCVYIAVRLSASRSETTTHTNSSRTKLFFYCFLALPETNVNIFCRPFKLWMHRVWTAEFFPYTRLSREFVLLSRTCFSKNKTWSRKIHLLLFFDIFVFTITVISALGL